jgi:hypothetical protein
MSPARRRDSLKRAHIIELSSDGEDSPRPPPARPLNDVVNGADVRQITPITVDSTDSVVGSNADDVADMLEVTEEELFNSMWGDVHDDKMEGTSSVAETSQGTSKGKEKEAATDPSVFDLQEELECFICCTTLHHPSCS